MATSSFGTESEPFKTFYNQCQFVPLHVLHLGQIWRQAAKSLPFSLLWA